MPWFPEFTSAVELARRQTRAAGQADPVAQYLTALERGDTHALETAWPGEVVIYDPRAGEIRGHRQLRRFISQNQSWLAGRHARIETVASTVAGGRAVVELLAHLAGDGREMAWPIAVVAESPDDQSVVFRTYCSQWPVDGRRHLRPRAGLAVAALALPGLLLASAATAAASPVAAAAAQAGKPVPVRPPSSPGAGTGASIPAKPHGLREISLPSTWTVTLTASPNLLWPTQYSTLTATTSTDVGPTPYYLRIYDLTAGAYVVTCATGTTCSAPVTQPTPATHYYVAVVSYASAGYPPSGEVAVSGEAGVVWHGVSLTLAASQTTVPVGAASTLTATTSQDIGPSPFWTEIFDVTTGTRIAVCGYGTTCSATVSQAAATTHEYIAYLSDDSTAYPPPGIQQTSLLSFVTWSSLGWQVSLSAPATTYGSETVTAAANGNVGPTPYYIEIFNETGTRLAACGSGSTCSATFTPSYAGSNLVAFVSGYGTAFPPPAIVASSSVITSYLRIIP